MTGKCNAIKKNTLEATFFLLLKCVIEATILICQRGVKEEAGVKRNRSLTRTEGEGEDDGDEE